MLIPLLTFVGVAVVLFQFRGVLRRAYLRARASHWIEQDPHEAKILDDLDIKRLCSKCGGEMEHGVAVVHFWSHDQGLTPLGVPPVVGSLPDALPMVSPNPFQRQIIGRNTYYCRKCQIFELNPKETDTQAS